jgi:hypothetical protein
MRKIYEIAMDIIADWKNISPHARPYLHAMTTLDDMSDSFGLDSAQTIIVYFLGNAQGYRGETARKVKKELKDMLK